MKQIAILTTRLNFPQVNPDINLWYQYNILTFLTDEKWRKSSARHITCCTLSPAIPQLKGLSGL